MRGLFLIAVLISAPALADAYKCKSPAGQVVFTEKPCEVGHTSVRAVSSDGIDDAAVARAQLDLERQKAWVSGREKMHQEDAAIYRQRAAAADAGYVTSPAAQTKSESIFDKPWGCGNRSCSTTASRR